MNEDKIWDTITDSAKSKFDFASFKKDFLVDDDVIPDNIVFKIIVEFASNKKTEMVVMQVRNDLLSLGINWAEEDLTKFMADKKDLFKKEIFAAGLASDMLRDGNPPASVFVAVSQLL